MTTTETVTTCIAVYGAVLSTVTIIRQMLGDRVKVKLRVSQNMKIIGDPNYAGMTLIVLEAINTGRRPVNVVSIGATQLFPEMSDFVAPDNKPRLPCEISEGKYITTTIDQGDTDISTIDYWWVLDSNHRTYKLRQASWLRHLVSVVRRKLARGKER